MIMGQDGRGSQVVKMIEISRDKSMLCVQGDKGGQGGQGGQGSQVVKMVRVVRMVK